MKWIFGFVMLCAALWSGYWFVGASAQQQLFTSFLQDSRAKGWTAQSRSLGVQGFPSRFDTTLTHIDFKDPSGQWGWQGESFKVKALSYVPNHVILAWPGTQVIDTPAGRLTLNAALLRASLVVSPTPDLPLSRLQIEGTGVDIQGDQGWSGRVKSLNAALFANASLNTRYHLGIDAKDITPPAKLTSLLGGGTGLADMVSLLHLSARLDFDRVIDRHAMENSAPPKPVHAIIEPSRIVWGESELSVSGELSVDSAGYIEGNLEVKSSNWQPLFKVFKHASHLKTTEKLTLGRALAAAAPQGHLDVILTFANGKTSIGPFQIGPAPLSPF